MNSLYLKDKHGVFIATCVVTNKAKKKWIKFVKDEVKKLSEKEKVFISWCSTLKRWKLRENFYELYPKLKCFKNKIELLGEEPKSKNLNYNLNLPQNLYTKKFILIQSWCDNYCSFCLIVKKRWENFYKKKKEILKEIIEFEKEWWKEIVLTWINLWAWWLESTNEYKKSRLGELLEYILENSKIWRIRISSLGPEFVNNKVLKIFKNKRIYPHFHYSVQSWSTQILKKMNRHYNEKYLKNILQKTKDIIREDNIDISLWADIMIWFPWETDKDFEKTYNLVKEIGIQKVHIFPFSAHKTWESIPAWNFINQISKKTKQKRLKKLNTLADEIREKFINFQKWKLLEVLIEKVEWKNFKGWTQNYIKANEKNFKILSWEIKRNKVIIWKLKK